MNSKKKVAVIVPELLPVPPVKGGAVEHWVHEVVGRMSSAKYDITVISRPSGISQEGNIQYWGIPWTRVESFFQQIKERVTWRNPIRYIAKIQNVLSYGVRLAKKVKHFDLLYIHNEPNLLFCLKLRSGQRVILHMHNEHLCTKLFRPFYRRALKKVDKVICVSDYIRKSALRIYPEYEDKFCVVFNATDPNEFRPFGDIAKEHLSDIIQMDSEHQYILYVGRLNPVKGVHVLIEAFKRVIPKFPNARLIITGSSFFEGAVRTEYEQELVRLSESIDHAIVFTGFLSHEKLKYLYSAVDVVSVPSIWQDPCPLVVLEAMASGTCVVGSEVGGVPEIVEDNINGILVSPGDADHLADSVCRVLENASLRKMLGTKARDKIQASYKWERLVKEIEQVFEGG